MSCTACPLHQSAISVCVSARGPSGAKVLVVGQNPGAEENLEGEAFVGKSGRLLDAMLADAGFAPEDVRLTNAVRCVTPENRVPFPSEAVACSPHLIDEINEIKPEVIIAMGEVALKALVGPKALSSVRGQELALHTRFGLSIPVYATWHPAFVLRRPMARSTVVSDLRRVRDRFKEQSEQAWQPFAPYNSPLVRRDLQPCDVAAYDIETYDENGEVTDATTQVAVATDNQAPLVTIRLTDDLLTRLRERAKIIVGHNSWNFDDHKTGIESDYDTMLMAYLDDETQPLGLESLCVKYFGVRGWKEDRGAPLGSAELAAYNARDAALTLRLFHHLRDKLGDRMKIIDHIIRPARRALDAASRRGIWIDPDAVEQARVETQRLLDERKAWVLREVAATGFPDDYFDVQLKTKVKHVPFNPNSNDHVGTLLTWLGFRLPQTKEGDPKVDKETLIYLDHPVCRALEAYREVAKKMSTYVKPYAKIAAEGDGRARSTFKLHVTDTGRSSASKPNTQNLDRDLKKFKNAPPGRVLASADYSAVEFRMGAFVANEPTIIGNFTHNRAWDPHTWFAARLYGYPEAEITKDSKERQEAKSANFSQLYMGTGTTIRDYLAREMGMFVTPQRGEEIHQAWHAAFPGWQAYYDDVKAEMLANGYVESLTGRRRHFGDLSLLNRVQLIEAWRQAVNFKVQSFCADIAFIALGACHAAGLPIVDFVHDEISLDIPEDECDTTEKRSAWAAKLKECMVDIPLKVLKQKFGVVPTVPLEIETTFKDSGRRVGAR